jgi:membrane-associated phospholipid phosphatase
MPSAHSDIDQRIGWSASTMARRTGANLRAAARSLLSLQRLRKQRLRTAWGNPARLILGTAFAVAAIVMAMFLIDAAAIAMQRKLTPAMVGVFSVITDFGKASWVLLPVGLLFLLIATVVSPGPGRISDLVLVSLSTRLGFVFLAVGLPSSVTTILKQPIGRARPYWESSGPFDYLPFSGTNFYASLPSGHATVVFALATAVGALYPRLRIPLWTFAAIIALSRLAVSAHYPSDLIAAAIVGVLGAEIVRHAFAARRLAFSATPDGRVCAMPGPSRRRLVRAVRVVLGRR